jgi:predicted HD phosphohydrolase
MAFELEPFADEATRLRRYDDDGKVDGLDVAPLAAYRELLTRVLSAVAAGGMSPSARSTTT